MTTDPLSLPPGPKRRAAMDAIGMNVSLADFTAAERAEIAAESAREEESFEKNSRPISDLYRVES
ncbi:hypothetical protein [Nocardioides sp. InS609-2]|uniref:hypothetical protein n=1 Tax=Nocardioides sp. InS609-2 TaxID=2760705 RepID=UPI0020BD7F5D|nr:hypothetical protein [Nocardioides sp. InS609-2]